MTRKEQITSAMVASLLLIKNAGYPINGDIEPTARAWAEVLEPDVKEQGVWIIKEATLNCLRGNDKRTITVSDIRREITELSRPSSSERERAMRALKRAERQAEEEQEEYLLARTPEQIREADEMWRIMQEGRVKLADVWKVRSQGGRIW